MSSGVGRRSRNLIVTFVIALFAISAANANKKPPLRPVNLNTATALELQQVPGIGPSTADKILQMRKSYGAFKTVDDLRAIKGIGPKRIEKMRKYVTVGRAVPAKKTGNLAASKDNAVVKPSAAMPTAKNGAAKSTAPSNKNR